ncbi:MAG TPA: hypothetical protein VE263_02025, partial [Candidatus Angelobacter sp.]|nr:hypothetical protein [Candidatus Angelobacter sp.]
PHDDLSSQGRRQALVGNFCKKAALDELSIVTYFSGPMTTSWIAKRDRISRFVSPREIHLG